MDCKIWKKIFVLSSSLNLRFDLTYEHKLPPSKHSMIKCMRFGVSTASYILAIRGCDTCSRRRGKEGMWEDNRRWEDMRGYLMVYCGVFLPQCEEVILPVPWFWSRYAHVSNARDLSILLCRTFWSLLLPRSNDAMRHEPYRNYPLLQPCPPCTCPWPPCSTVRYLHGPLKRQVGEIVGILSLVKLLCE